MSPGLWSGPWMVPVRVAPCRGQQGELGQAWHIRPFFVRTWAPDDFGRPYLNEGSCLLHKMPASQWQRWRGPRHARIHQRGRDGGDRDTPGSTTVAGPAPPSPWQRWWGPRHARSRQRGGTSLPGTPGPRGGTLGTKKCRKRQECPRAPRWPRQGATRTPALGPAGG